MIVSEKKIDTQNFHASEAYNTLGVIHVIPAPRPQECPVMTVNCIRLWCISFWYLGSMEYPFTTITLI